MTNPKKQAGRKPKLSQETWDKIINRNLAGGESATDLAREYGVTEGAIRKRTIMLKKGFIHLVDRDAEHVFVNDVITNLKTVSANLAETARASTDTSRIFAIIANNAAKKLNLDDVTENEEEIKIISAMIKLSNDAAQIGIGLVNAASRGALTADTQEEEKEVKKITRTIVDNES